MLVQDFVDVSLPLKTVEDALADEPNLGVWAEAAFRSGEDLAVGPSRAIRVPVTLEVGEPVHSSDSVRYPIRWEARDARWMFPHMEAELVINEITEKVTHLTLRGSYRPPLEGFGQALDRLAFHRIAEATVRNFLERLAAGLVRRHGG